MVKNILLYHYIRLCWSKPILVIIESLETFKNSDLNFCTLISLKMWPDIWIFVRSDILPGIQVQTKSGLKLVNNYWSVFQKYQADIFNTKTTLKQVLYIVHTHKRGSLEVVFKTSSFHFYSELAYWPKCHLSNKPMILSYTIVKDQMNVFQHSNMFSNTSKIAYNVQTNTKLISVRTHNFSL